MSPQHCGITPALTEASKRIEFVKLESDTMGGTTIRRLAYPDALDASVQRFVIQPNRLTSVFVSKCRENLLESHCHPHRRIVVLLICSRCCLSPLVSAKALVATSFLQVPPWIRGLALSLRTSINPVLNPLIGKHHCTLVLAAVSTVASLILPKFSPSAAS